MSQVTTPNDRKATFDQSSEFLLIQHTVCMVAWDITPLPEWVTEADHRQRRFLRERVKEYARLTGFYIDWLAREGPVETWAIRRRDEPFNVPHWKGTFQGCCLKMLEYNGIKIGGD